MRIGYVATSLGRRITGSEEAIRSPGLGGAAIFRASTDADVRPRLRRLGREQAGRFAWPEVARRVQALYNDPSIRPV